MSRIIFWLWCIQNVLVVLAGSLHDACMKGDVDRVKSILESENINVNAYDDNGFTALGVLATQNIQTPEHEEIMNLLIKHPGINLDLGKENGPNPLFLAASQGNYRMATLISFSYLNINSIVPSTPYCTPLLATIKNADDDDLSRRNRALEFAKMLLTHTYINVNVRCGKKIPLLEAIKYTDQETVELILKKNVQNINDVDDDGNGALHVAFRSLRASGCLGSLKNAKEIKYNMTDKNGNTVLHLAGEGMKSSDDDVIFESYSVIKEFPWSAQDFNAQNINGQTFWHLLMSAPMRPLVQQFLKILPFLDEFDLSLVDKDKCTSIDIAAKNGNIQILHQLVEDEGFIVQMLQNLRINYPEETLLKKHPFDQGYLQVAIERGWSRVVGMLLSDEKFGYSKDVNLYRWFEEGKIEKIKFLRIILSLPTNSLNIPNEKKELPFHVFLKTMIADKTIPWRLLHSFCDTLVKKHDFTGYGIQDVEGNTILHLLYILLSRADSVDSYGLSKSIMGLFEQFKSKNFDFNTQNMNGETILHLAMKAPFSNLTKDVLVFLVRHDGFKLHLANKNGATALQLASKHGIIEYVSFLLGVSDEDTILSVLNDPKINIPEETIQRKYSIEGFLSDSIFNNYLNVIDLLLKNPKYGYNKAIIKGSPLFLDLAIEKSDNLGCIEKIWPFYKDSLKVTEIYPWMRNLEGQMYTFFKDKGFQRLDDGLASKILRPKFKMQILGMSNPNSLILGNGENADEIPMTIMKDLLTVRNMDETSKVSLMLKGHSNDSDQLSIKNSGGSFVQILQVGILQNEDHNYKIAIDSSNIHSETEIVTKNDIFVLIIPTKSTEKLEIDQAKLDQFVSVINKNRYENVATLVNAYMQTDFVKSLKDKFAVMLGKFVLEPYITQLENFPISVQFPSWFDPSGCLKKISVGNYFKSDQNLKSIWARRIMLLARTVWYLHLYEKSNFEFWKRYPYEMAAVLGLVDWSTAMTRIEADGFMTQVRSTKSALDIKFARLEALNKYITLNWDSDPYAAMSMHAFEVLLCFNGINYIPPALALIPSDQQVFMLLNRFMIGAIRPIETFDQVLQLNKTFNVEIYNLLKDDADFPFNVAPAVIKLRDCELKDLFLNQKGRNQLLLLLPPPINWSIIGAKVKKLSFEKLEVTKSTTLPSYLTMFSNLKLSTIDKSSKDEIEVRQQVAPDTSTDICAKISDILSKFDHQFSKLIQERHVNNDCDVTKALDEGRLRDILEKLQLILDLRQSNPLNCLEDISSILPWTYASMLGLIEWDITVEKCVKEFSTNKRLRRDATRSSLYINWFSDRRHNILKAKFGDIFARFYDRYMFDQTEMLVYALVQIYVDNERVVDLKSVSEALKIMISIMVTTPIECNRLYIRLLNLAPLDMPVWFDSNSVAHAMIKRYIPRLYVTGNRSFDVRLFNTGAGAEIHEMSPKYPEHFFSFVEFKNVPLALLNIDSYDFRVSTKDAEAIKMAFGDTDLIRNSWTAYPDEHYRVSNFFVEGDETKDLTKGQFTGTCAARSLMVAMKSELGTPVYQKLKIEIALKLLRRYPKTFYNKNNSKDILELIVELLPERLYSKVDRFLKSGVWNRQSADKVRKQIDMVLDEVNRKDGGRLQLSWKKTEGDLEGFQMNIRGSYFEGKLKNGQTLFRISLKKLNILEWKLANSADLLSVMALRNGAVQYLNSGKASLQPGDIITVNYITFDENGKMIEIIVELDVVPFKNIIHESRVAMDKEDIRNEKESDGKGKSEENQS